MYGHHSVQLKEKGALETLPLIPSGKLESGSLALSSGRVLTRTSLDFSRHLFSTILKAYHPLKPSPLPDILFLGFLDHSIRYPTLLSNPTNPTRLSPITLPAFANHLLKPFHTPARLSRSFFLVSTTICFHPFPKTYKSSRFLTRAHTYHHRLLSHLNFI